jgi:hypothetical protein
MRRLLSVILLLWIAVGVARTSLAQDEIKTESPSINAIKKSLSDRYALLKTHFESGHAGLTHDGLVALRARPSAPEVLETLERLIADENKDRETLIREIARANGRPEWEDNLRATFAERWRARVA